MSVLQFNPFFLTQKRFHPRVTPAMNRLPDQPIINGPLKHEIPSLIHSNPACLSRPPFSLNLERTLIPRRIFERPTDLRVWFSFGLAFKVLKVSKAWRIKGKICWSASGSRNFKYSSNCAALFEAIRRGKELLRSVLVYLIRLIPLWYAIHY